MEGTEDLSQHLTDDEESSLASFLIAACKTGHLGRSSLYQIMENKNPDKIWMALQGKDGGKV